jgi:aerobic-type carbon monoxide dehydrogenase small subunit (CoxS/CutS family)
MPSISGAMPTADFALQHLLATTLSGSYSFGIVRGADWSKICTCGPNHILYSFKGGVPMISFSVNHKQVSLDIDPSTPLLWVLRDNLGLTGTKYGCGMAQCGACTVHLDGEAIRSCVAPVSRAAGKEVTTIEGLSPDMSHPLQRAWIVEDVPQCGYCQSGQLMSAAVLLREKPRPSDDDIDQAMTGNICRCGTYPRIRKAIHRAAGMMSTGGAK